MGLGEKMIGVKIGVKLDLSKVWQVTATAPAIKNSRGKQEWIPEFRSAGDTTI